MFKYNDERHGSGYIELQYCAKKKRLFKKEKYFRDDSLYIDVDKFNEFYNIYNDYLKKFSKYPITEIDDNYFDIESTKEILDSLKKDKPKYSNRLIEWLEKCIKEYDGFYIIGV